MFAGPFEESIVKRAQDKSLVEINIHNLRKWGLTERRTVDGRPYSGGAGMILRVDIIDAALSAIRSSLPVRQAGLSARVVLLDAAGEKFTQQKALQLTKVDQLILIAGHYEGVDHRVHEHLVDEVISIGDYVLTGGELPAMVVTDSIVRLLPGVIGKEESLKEESHNKPGYLEYPQYTRPEVYKGWKVPKVLLSGNHKEINKWKEEKTK